MVVRDIDRVQKYSQILVQDAKTKGELQDLIVDVQALMRLFEQQRLATFLGDRLVEESEKIQLVRTIQLQASELLSHFLDTIILNRQYHLIYDVFTEIVYTSQFAVGQFDMVVRVVVPMTGQQKEHIIEVIQSRLNLRIRQVIEVIDESILGGFIAEVNHKVIDASVKHQLQIAKNNFSK